jgi:hypothetical protein
MGDQMAPSPNRGIPNGKRGSGPLPSLVCTPSPPSSPCLTIEF